MPTFIYSKKDFIKYLEEQIKEDQAIVFTNELCGSITGSEKNGIKISHPYAPKVFKDIGVGHIAFGKTIPLGLLICNKDRLNESSLSLIETTTG